MFLPFSGSNRRDEARVAEKGRLASLCDLGLLAEGIEDHAFVGLDANGAVTSWNVGAERIKGYRADEIIGRHFAIFYPPADLAQRVPAADLAAAHADGSVRVEGWRVRKDGSQFWATTVITALYDEDRGLRGFGEVTRDSTAQREADEDLAHKSRRLQAAESIGHIGSWELDVATDTVAWSDTLCQLHGLRPEEFDGDFLSRIHIDDRNELNAAVTECLSTGRPLRIRHRVLRADTGELRWLEAFGEQVKEGDQVVRLAGAVIDVTEQVDAAREMAEARLAVEASRQKSAFLATVSHEIRTPMNAVIGMTALLLDTGLDNKQRGFVETVRASGDALLAIINNILDFSKIEAGGLVIEHRRFDLRTCVERALDLSGAASNAKGLEIIADIDEGCPAAAIGDVTRVRQVLVNLLSNAVKFTTTGQVVVTVEPTDDPYNGEKVALRFAVSDTGIGIPADHLANLFDAFTQVDGSTTRTYGGTGLGLAISRRLVEAMGSTLKVDSVSDAGSTFHFSVAFDRAAPTGAPGDALPARLGGRSALLVDDNATSRRVLMHMLEAWGMRVTAAASAEIAMLVVDGGGTFNVVVVDRCMPVMSGVDLAVVLRQSPPTMDLPFILLDSTTDRPIPDRSRLFSAVLTKPVRAGALLQSLSAVLPKDAAASASPGPQLTTPSESHAMRVLLVEDNPINQLVGRRLVEKLGHSVDLADNGREATEAVRLVSYDTVLMDIQMPEMDGLEATKIIRQELPASRQPRIVALTASTLIEDRQACDEAGMDDYLSKPVRIEDLENALCGSAR